MEAPRPRSLAASQLHQLVPPGVSHAHDSLHTLDLGGLSSPTQVPLPPSVSPSPSPSPSASPVAHSPDALLPAKQLHDWPKESTALAPGKGAAAAPATIDGSETFLATAKSVWHQRRALLSIAGRGLRQNVVPALFLQVACVGITVSYYVSSSFRDAVGSLESLQDTLGLAFPMIATSLFGGILPFLFTRLINAIHDRRAGRLSGQAADVAVRVLTPTASPEPSSKRQSMSLSASSNNTIFALSDERGDVRFVALASSSPAPLEQSGGLPARSPSPSTSSMAHYGGLENGTILIPAADTTSAPTASVSPLARSPQLAPLPPPSHQMLLAELVFLACFWGYKGLEVHGFYQLQTLMFGEGASPGIIAAKVVADQFVYIPVWACWTCVAAFMLRDEQFHLDRWRARLNYSFILVTIPTNLLSNWLVWIPACCLIYCLPTPLQQHLFNLVLCFNVLVMGVLARQPPPGAEASPSLTAGKGDQAAAVDPHRMTASPSPEAPALSIVIS